MSPIAQHPTPTAPSRRTRTIAAAGAAAVVAAAPFAAALAAPTSPTASASTRGPVVAETGPAPKTLTGTGHHDLGRRPVVYDIHKHTVHNTAYRDTLWTGNHLQLTVMSIKRHDDIGLEMHPTVDQFIRVESGHGVAKMGPDKNHLTYVRRVDKDSAVLIPAGTWHDVINTGRSSLKVYSLYAEPNHPRATYHATKKAAQDDPLEKKKYPRDVEAK